MCPLKVIVELLRQAPPNQLTHPSWGTGVEHGYAEPLCHGLLNSRHVTHDSDLARLLIDDWIAYCTNDSDLARLLIDDWIAYCTNDSDLARSLVYKGLRRSRESPKLDLVSNLSPVEPSTIRTPVPLPQTLRHQS